MSDSSEPSRSRHRPHEARNLESKFILNSKKDESGSDNTQTSQGSRGSQKSLKNIPKPKVTVLEQLSFPTNVEEEVTFSGNEGAHKGTATTHDSTCPTVITAVLRDLRDDIVHFPVDYRPTSQPSAIGPAALLNGDRAIAVIGGDNVYVQGRTKFIPVPREKALSTNNYRISPYYTSKVGGRSPLDVAILVQRVFAPISSICFGLLGGVALLQLIMVHHLGADPDRNFFLLSYSRLAELTPLLFHILLAICVISVLDRVPMQLEGAGCQPAWLVMAVYGLTVILTLSCAPYDDMFISYAHNQTQFQDPMKTQELVSEWRLLNGMRCVLALLGWVLFSLTSPPDLLLHHLQDAKQYIHVVPRIVK